MVQLKKYINLSNYFEEIQNEKFAELERIAYQLGAKRYHIEIEEEALELHKGEAKRNMFLKGNGKPGAEEENRYKEKKWHKTGIKAEGEFSEQDEPSVPELFWFKNVGVLNNLIEMRCQSGGQLTSRTLEFSYNSTASISKQFAGKLDAAIKGMGFKGNFSIQSQVEQEMRRKLIFNIEF